MSVIFIDSKPKPKGSTVEAIVLAFCEIEFDGFVDDPDVAFQPGPARCDIQFAARTDIFPLASCAIEFAGAAQSTDWFGPAKCEIEFSATAGGFTSVFYGGARCNIEFAGSADGSANTPDSYQINVIVDVVDDWGDPFVD